MGWFAARGRIVRRGEVGVFVCTFLFDVLLEISGIHSLIVPSWARMQPVVFLFIFSCSSACVCWCLFSLGFGALL